MLNSAGLLVAGAAGVMLWRALGPDRLRRLDPATADDRCAVLFLLGFLLNGLLLAAALALLAEDLAPPSAETETEAGTEAGTDQPGDALTTYGLEQVVVLQSLANLGMVLALLLIARAARMSPAALGLRPHAGPWAVPLAFAAWLAFLPLLAGAALVNEWLLDALGVQTDGSQAYLLAFVQDDRAASSPIVWFGMVLAIPLAEEVLYRGALFGGLRGRLGVPGALLVSGVLFGLGHDTVAWLPVSVLGIYLAWLYHRTGSLVVPVLVHALQNGSTLLYAHLLRDSVT